MLALQNDLLCSSPHTCDITRENASSSWDKPEGAADLCHGTQTMNSSRVCGCLLSVRAATMATHAWTKLHAHHELNLCHLRA